MNSFKVLLGVVLILSALALANVDAYAGGATMARPNAEVSGHKFHFDPLFDEITSLGPLSSDLGLGFGRNPISRFGMPNMPLQISETDDIYKVKAELPGIGSTKDIELKIDQGILSIKAEKKKETTEDGEFYHREEFSHGVFTRQVRLPDYIDINVTPSATFNNGVLSVDLKKNPENKNQAITIPISG